MKAIQINEIGGTEVLTYTEVKRPIPLQGQVVVKVKAAPVNYIDTIIREGNMPPGMMPSLPFIPGVEGAGIIEDGNGTGLEKGQKVAFLGVIGSSVYAEYVVIDAKKLVLLNQGIDLLEAAVLPVNYFTAYHMLKNVAKAEAGKTALIYAASGGVGTALIQIAKLLKLNIVALERRDAKVKNAFKMGANYAYNSTHDNWIAALEADLGANCIDYVFNPVAGDSIKADLAVLAPLGQIVVFGFLGGLGTFNLIEESAKYFGKAPSIHFSEIYATYTNHYNLVEQDMKQLYQWLAEGKIKPVFETMPLQDAQAAHAKLQAGEVRGKLLLTV